MDGGRIVAQTIAWDAGYRSGSAHSNEEIAEVQTSQSKAGIACEPSLDDREAIREVLYLYCRGVDRGDADVLDRVYWPEAIDNHGSFVGSKGEFIGAVMNNLAAMTSNHSIGNILIEADGLDHAICESYFSAVHRIVDDRTPRDWTLIGRYIDRFEKRGAEWRIIHRYVVIDHERLEAATGILEEFAVRDDARGACKPDDPLYRKRD